MARKTVAKRHAKILPVSSEARAAIDQDNADFPALPSVTPPKQHAPETGRPRLAAQFDALGEWSEPSDQPKAETEKRTRGRPRKAKAEAPPIDEIPDTPDERLTDTDTRGTDTPDELAGQMDAFAVDEKQTPDYEQGRKDAAAGRVDCLNSDIKGAPYRYREWKRGFASVKR
jgi:hypothetical protein